MPSIQFFLTSSVKNIRSHTASLTQRWRDAEPHTNTSALPFQQTSYTASALLCHLEASVRPREVDHSHPSVTRLKSEGKERPVKYTTQASKALGKKRWVARNIRHRFPPKHKEKEKPNMLKGLSELLKLPLWICHFRALECAVLEQ